jgi:hypothetical protein
MFKNYWWIIPVILILVIGIGIYLCLPRYKVIQADRQLAWGNNPSTFIMSPAKIEVTNLHWGFPLTIPVKITNSAGDMNYTIKYQDPSTFDKGYINADGNNVYSYTFNKSTIDVANNSSEVVRITIKKNSLFDGASGIEKGIAISQNPQSNGMANLAFSYVFEILIK